MTSNPIVSIIVPVYNTEKYLLRCLISIQKSSFKDYEVILIDDGSTDSSSKICDSFVKGDVRFYVIHTANYGVSHARNVGLEKTRGKYIVFIDSDDYIEEDYLQSICIQKEDYVFCGHKSVFENRIISTHSRQKKLLTKSELKTIVNEEGRNAFPVSVTMGCYKANIINSNHIRFDESICYGEDCLFNFRYIDYCELIRTDDNISYCYEMVEGSLFHKYQPLYAYEQEIETQCLERFVEHDNMRWRYFAWHKIINYYEKWKNEKKTTKIIKQCYSNSYFRESIPYIRENGSFDEKLETYLMGYYRHKLIHPILKVMKLLYQMKQ